MAGRAPRAQGARLDPATLLAWLTAGGAERRKEVSAAEMGKSFHPPPPADQHQVVRGAHPETPQFGSCFFVYSILLWSLKSVDAP